MMENKDINLTRALLLHPAILNPNSNHPKIPSHCLLTLLAAVVRQGTLHMSAHLCLQLGV